VIVPESSIEYAADAGVRAHTNFLIFVPDGAPIAQDGPPAAAETPASLACVYELVSQVKGCPISRTKKVPTGGSEAVAIVDADDNPDAATDLKVFSKQFGLPQADFKVVYASGQQPPNDPGAWSLEEALDIEWAHAMAPKAKIYLVEAASDSFSDLLAAESVASGLVAEAGGGEVSNSWGSSEFTGEQNDDSYFTTSGVVYFASTGLKGDVLYPSASPNVVAAGGTTVNRNSSGDFTGETGCCYSGDSVYEPRPSYQDGIKKIVGDYRGTPDFSFDASASSGVAVYDADGGYGWVELSGTSVSSPSLAGIVNCAGKFFDSTDKELTTIYDELQNKREYHEWFRDIIKGTGCRVGWDFCSGVGSDLAYHGK
jgi:subtilase family serine protease